MYLEIAYASYIVISVSMTIWVARTLHRNGRVFLVDAFHGNTALADSVNHLLVVGFYLINLGYIAIALTAKNHPSNWGTVIELVSWKIGVVLLVLGGMHFFNLYVFSRLRSRGMESQEPPPIEPTEVLPTAGG